MVAYVMRTFKGSWDKDNWVSKSQLLGSDDKISHLEGPLILHTIYQYFHAHCVRLIDEGVAHQMFDNRANLELQIHDDKNPSVLTVIYKPINSKDDIVIQSFHAMKINDEKELKELTTGWNSVFPGLFWESAVAFFTKQGYTEKLKNREIEVSSYWKKVKSDDPKLDNILQYSVN